MIKRVSRRRYMMKYHAIEIEFIDSLLVLLDFVDKNEDQFVRELQRVRQNKLLTQGARLKANKVDFYDAGCWDDSGDRVLGDLVQQWRRRELSNLQYLCKLNLLASRSGLDLSQYPVVPWVAELSNPKQPKIRDLSKTMGALGSQQRVKALLEKFSSRDPFNPVPAFYYGTHYSSPGVVFNFLVRLAPFSGYLKNLQGGKFDLADRLFSSVVSCWKSAYNQISDVRELVPEFYYLPEMFLNLERHNFGETQNGERIHNVEMPQWAGDSPYNFVTQFRQMLESEQASEKLGDWVDLVFGYKQRGEEAEKSLNLYYYLTYEEYSDLEEEDEVHRKSCEAQIVHFGQVPPQLFAKPHLKKISLPVQRSLLELGFTEEYLLMNKFKGEAPLSVHVDQDKRQLVILTKISIQQYSLQKNPISLLKTSKLNLQKSSSTFLSYLGQLYYLLRKDTFKAVFFKTQPYFFVSAYLNNELRLYHKLNPKIQTQIALPTPILSLHLNDQENLLMVGCANGTLTLYEIQFDQKAKIILHQVHRQQFIHPVTFITEYDGWTLIVFGSYCAIYKVSRALNYFSTPNSTPYKPTFQMIRSFKNSLKIAYALIVTCPLYSLIIVDNASIKCYSINGQLIKSRPANVRTQPFLLQHHDMNQYVCFVEEDRVVVMSTPDLRSVSELELPDYLAAFENICIFNDRICLLGW